MQWQDKGVHQLMGDKGRHNCKTNVVIVLVSIALAFHEYNNLPLVQISFNEVRSYMKDNDW